VGELLTSPGSEAARRGRRRPHPAAVALLAAVLGGGSGCALPADPSPAAAPRASGHSPRPARSPTRSTPAKKPTVPAAPHSALAALGTLAVKGRAALTGYDRDLFGQAWADVDRNGCDTRNDVLRRDLTGVQIEDGTHGCKVLAGTAAPEPYTGLDVRFVYAGPSEIDVDHVVALGNAWQTGADRWSGETRLAFANDPLNLLAVQASANRQKGDGDAATWLPPRRSYRCAYVARQTAVKRKYALWVTPAERAAIARVLATCPSTPLPMDDAPVQRLGSGAGTSTGGYASCAAARAAGAAPVRAGDPGYSRSLDGDGDGVGCE